MADIVKDTELADRMPSGRVSDFFRRLADVLDHPAIVERLKATRCDKLLALTQNVKSFLWLDLAADPRLLTDAECMVFEIEERTGLFGYPKESGCG